MTSIDKVAVFGASGNFGRPITNALIKAGYKVTAISRQESSNARAFPPEVSVVKTNYALEELTQALAGQDAAVCVIGGTGIGQGHPNTVVDAARAARVKRLVIDDFGWGPVVHRLPEFAPIHAKRKAQWDYAKAKAEEAGNNTMLTWTGITIGNPIDWALKKFPLMGFDVANQTATIYDEGREEFTGTTLDGIGQSVVGVFQHLDETANRFVKIMSIKTCQDELLQAFNKASERAWDVQRSTTQALIERGRQKLREGDNGWVLDLVVAQLYDVGQQWYMVAPSREESDSDCWVLLRKHQIKLYARHWSHVNARAKIKLEKHILLYGGCM